MRYRRIQESQSLDPARSECACADPVLDGQKKLQENLDSSSSDDPVAARWSAAMWSGVKPPLIVVISSIERAIAAAIITHRRFTATLEKRMSSIQQPPFLTATEADETT